MYNILMEYKAKYIDYKTKYINLQYGGKKKMIIKNTKNKRLGRNNKMDKRKQDYEMNVSEPWFSLIVTGSKTIEGRLKKGQFAKMKKGEIVKWINNDYGQRSVITEITKITEYNTFEDYLTNEGLDNCLPTITNIKDGVNVYYKYYTPENEKEFGVLAIELHILT